MFACRIKVPDYQIQSTKEIESESGVSKKTQEESRKNHIRESDEMEMVYVPGGSFLMGSTQSEIEDAIQLCREHYHTCNRWYYERESPLHTVTLEDFWIDQVEVSNQQYQQCIEDGICAVPLTCDKGKPTISDPHKSNHPVVCVSWNDAHDYCQWAGARLPTEAEWEFALRGETGSIFPWGNEFEGSKLNFCDINCDQDHADERYNDTFSQTAPVGSFPSGVSWSGVLNMSGNVSEWVADWFGGYSAEPAIDPQGPSTGTLKMLKGCAWFFHPTYCRGAARPAVDPDTRFDYLGFRCAASFTDDG